MPSLAFGKDGSWMDWPLFRSKSSVWARAFPSEPPEMRTLEPIVDEKTKLLQAFYLLAFKNVPC